MDMEAAVESWLACAACAVYAGLVLFAVFHHLFYPLDYWERRGVPSVDALPLFGNFADSILGRSSYVDDLCTLYRRLKPHGFGGIFESRSPRLLMCEPRMIQRVLCEDAACFQDRGHAVGEDPADPLSASLFNLRGGRWRGLRDSLAPAFSEGSAEAMLPLLAECAEQLSDCLAETLSSGSSSSVDLLDLLTRFSTDVVGSCAFGVPCNCIRDPDSELYRVARAASRRSPLRAALSGAALAAVSAWRPLARLLPARWLHPAATAFFIDMMRETVQFRERTGTRRQDFVDLMMSARQASDAGDDNSSFLSDKDRRHHVELTYDVMAAQAYVFFVAGLDSVANTVGFCLHELALHPALQDRVAAEVAAAVSRGGEAGWLSSEGLADLQLLDRVVLEGLRKYPPCELLVREVTGPEPYALAPGVALDPGTRVYVCVRALHRDPELHPEPERFHPGRFEEGAERHPYSFLPFGAGPRGCAASPFALLQMKVCLAALLRGFAFGVSPRTREPLRLDPRAPGPCPRDGFWLRVNRRDAKTAPASDSYPS